MPNVFDTRQNKTFSMLFTVYRKNAGYSLFYRKIDFAMTFPSRVSACNFITSHWLPVASDAKPLIFFIFAFYDNLGAYKI